MFGSWCFFFSFVVISEKTKLDIYRDCSNVVEVILVIHEN